MSYLSLNPNGTPTVPAGLDTYIQYNNGGVFGGDSNLTWDGTNLNIGLNEISSDLNLGSSAGAGNLNIGQGAFTVNIKDGQFTADNGNISSDGAGDLVASSLSGGSVSGGSLSAISGSDVYSFSPEGSGGPLDLVGSGSVPVGNIAKFNFDGVGGTEIIGNIQIDGTLSSDGGSIFSDGSGDLTVNSLILNTNWGEPIYMDRNQDVMLIEDSADNFQISLGYATTIHEFSNTAGVSFNNGFFVSDLAGNTTWNGTLNSDTALIYSDGAGDLTTQGLNTNSITLTSTTANTVIIANGSNQLVSGNAATLVSLGVPVVVAHANLTGRTAAVSPVATITPSVAGTFRVGGYVTITAIATDVLELEVTYTDETSAARTAIFYPQGTTSGLLATTGAYVFPTMDIRTKISTAITVKTILTTGGGTITYDVGATIMYIN